MRVRTGTGWNLVLLALLLLSPTTALAGGPVGGELLIADQSVDAVYPALAHNTIWDEYLAVWSNDRPGNDDIYAQLLDRQGAPSGNWRAIAAGTGAERRYPDVTYNPNWNEYLVVWEQENHASGRISIRGRRVSDSGQGVGPEITISASGPRTGTRPRVAHAFTSGTYLVVWLSLIHI